MLIFTESSLAPLNKSTRTPLKAAQKTPPPILTRNLGPAGDTPGFNARRTEAWKTRARRSRSRGAYHGGKKPQPDPLSTRLSS